MGEGMSETETPGPFRQESVEGRLSELYDAMLPVVFGYCRARLALEDAEDVTAEVFHAAAAQLRREPDRDLRPSWFVTTARNRVIDLWRRDARWSGRLRTMAGSSVGHIELPPEPDGPVLEALDRLPTAQRAAVVLHWIDGHTVREVAELLGRSEHAVESLLSRARRRLVTLVQEHPG